MSFVLVTADFPDVTSTQRQSIYYCLDENKWKKVTELGRDVSTVWYAEFSSEVSESSAIRISIDEFEKCSKPYCRPKLVLHWGPNKPTFHNLG